MGPGEQPKRGSSAPVLRPPGTTHHTDSAHANTYRWVWSALAAMLLLVLMVIFLLPQLISEHNTTKQATPVAQTPAPSVAPDSQEFREEATKKLEAYLRLRAKLELANTAAWGEPLWSEAAQITSAADRLFAEHNYRQASQNYANALQMLENLQNSRGEQLTAALDAGNLALDNDDIDTARMQFERALIIEPGHAQAQQGLSRARVRTEVIQHMDTANSAENDADLEAARVAFSQAMQLDSEYRPASDGFERVSQRLNDIGFRDAMSRALTALDSGRLKEASKALAEAALLKPDNNAVSDTRMRLARAQLQAKLNVLRTTTATDIQNEDWQAAVRHFQQAINLDASAGFANQGLAHAQNRVLLHQQFDHYLNDPTRLYSSAPQANAEMLLASAGQAPADEPKLARKIKKLKHYLADARKPLHLTLRSDGETNVVIYHVGRLGQFHDHQLELKPGTYTVVGSRPGYRDVRRIIKVEPGAPLPPVEIRCEEPV
jgi:tetratricopeptide (TPR) repeat protein